MDNIPVGIGACVSGRHNMHNIVSPDVLSQLGQDFQLVPFCPSVVASVHAPAVNLQPVHGTGLLSPAVLDMLQSTGLRGYIMQSGTADCGEALARCHGHHEYGRALSAELRRHLLIPVIEAHQLNSPLLADRFLQQVILADDFYRLPACLQPGDLTELYSRYKLSIMACSPQHYRQAGRLLGNLAGRDLHYIKDTLYLLLFDALQQGSNRARHTNALMHIQGYFRKKLSRPLRTELTQILEKYRCAEVPLSVPVILIRHYLSLYPDAYLNKQKYLAPYPEHYGLRNYL